MENRRKLSSPERQEVMLPWAWRRKLRWHAPGTLESPPTRTHQEEAQKHQKPTLSPSGYVMHQWKLGKNVHKVASCLCPSWSSLKIQYWELDVGRGRTFLLLFRMTFKYWAGSNNSAGQTATTRLNSAHVPDVDPRLLWNKRGDGKFGPSKQTFCHARRQQQDISTGSESHFLSEEPRKCELTVGDLELPSYSPGKL